MSISADLPARRARKARPSRSACLISLALAFGLAACVNANRPAPMATAAAAPMTDGDYEKAVAYWGQRYTANPKDKAAELNYAAALRRLDRLDQAAAVLQKAAIYHPEDREVLAAFGKA